MNKKEKEEFERLKLENAVLKNIIDCVREELEWDYRGTEHESSPHAAKVGAISAICDVEWKLKTAFSIGEAIDYRRKEMKKHGRQAEKP
ncbi:MAG: hypothetical protein Q4E86_07600 [Lachnospiraceae bacterium]|nr:hypothetical protein [Lachnospiraceae bacterium]